MTGFRVAPLRLATVELPEEHPEGAGPCEVFGFLITNGETHVLLDTGVGSGSSLIDRLYRPQRADLASELTSLGVEPAGITAVVNSHLHFDHCGNNRLFPGTPIYVQTAEFEAARGPSYTVPDWVRFPDARYELVDGELELFPGLVLIPTPGHSPGHQSLVVASEEGSQLVVAQAAYTAAEFADPEQSPVPAGTWDEDRYRESRALLHRLMPRRALFSHDPRTWTRSVP